MTRIDLDDLPPRLAALLTGLAEGEEVLLVRDGVVVGRLIGGAAARAEPEAAPELSPEEQAKEVFEHFRSAIEDEF